MRGVHGAPSPDPSFTKAKSSVYAPVHTKHVSPATAMVSGKVRAWGTTVKVVARFRFQSDGTTLETDAELCKRQCVRIQWFRYQVLRAGSLSSDAAVGSAEKVKR